MPTKVQITIEIPDGWELAEPEMRLPKIDEYYLDNKNNTVVKADYDFLDWKMPILKKSWIWPKWLKAPYIAMDCDGKWYAYSIEPSIIGNRWSSSRGCSGLYPDIFDMETPPTCTDWKQSLMKNPNL